MTCSMFMGNLLETGLKLKKLKHIGVFACIFDRRALLPRSWLHSIVFILNLIPDATSPERRRNDVVFATSITRYQSDVETTLIIRRL